MQQPWKHPGPAWAPLRGVWAGWPPCWAVQLHLSRWHGSAWPLTLETADTKLLRSKARQPPVVDSSSERGALLAWETQPEKDMRPSLQATTTCPRTPPACPGSEIPSVQAFPCWLGEITINLGAGRWSRLQNQSLHAQLFKFLRREKS